MRPADSPVLKALAGTKVSHDLNVMTGPDCALEADVASG
jgi:hypothetical protein